MNIFATLKNLISILFLVLSGIFIMPKASKACCCGHHTMKEMACCSRQSSHSIKNASCCSIYHVTHAHSQQENSCGRNGGCNCSSNNVVSAIIIEQPFIINQLKKTPKDFTSISPLPSGYFSFWQPPKIAR